MIAAVPITIAGLSYGAAFLGYKTKTLNFDESFLVAFLPTTLTFTAVFIGGAILSIFSPVVFLITMIGAALLITLPLAVFLYNRRKDLVAEREALLVQDQEFFARITPLIEALPEGEWRDKGEKLLSKQTDPLYPYEKLKIKLSRFDSAP